MGCFDCKNKRRVPGDEHITCTNPPIIRMTIGSGGDERYELAKQMANDNKVVVRCVWPGSGWYPLAFDGGTVFACSNFNKQEACR
jgi:hypothetical protein